MRKKERKKDEGRIAVKERKERNGKKKKKEKENEIESERPLKENSI